ncbi:hypothetical protein NO1_0642 [Candidatus Termititenax aidoneus]|uniref:Uncharacterized protein n=1 Tax=Termititenax aidoneus TaxID=2218524 RepID=A0A388TAC1_TERA1|nr:hypothetical protein NO1_0642 [Candidatus Termititenax aidoneus]
MFVKVIAQTAQETLTKAGIQRNNTQNFTAWKNFIAQNGYRPRSQITGAEQASLSAESYKLEIKLGKWATHVSQQLKGHVPYGIDWQYPEQQPAEFTEWWDKTPTWQQKNNTDNLAACREFSARHGRRPRQEISAGEAELLSPEDLRHELELGNWMAHAAQTLNDEKNRSRDWQYPEKQQAEFAEWHAQTPTCYQKQNADNLTAWKLFIARHGYRPRQMISVEIRRQMTELEYEQEVQLGKWANSISQPLPQKWNARVWQYEEQYAEFEKLWNEIPTFNQKLNADRLILLQEFCQNNGYRPSHDTSKDHPDIVSAGEISPEEDRLAIFVDTVRAGNSAFQYLEQYQQFEECLQYITHLVFLRKRISH